MKTYQEAILENARKFQAENEKIVRFYKLLNDYPSLKLGEKFWLEFGGGYDTCIYLGSDEDGYRHFYSTYIKGKKTYHDYECWELGMALEQGCTIEPYKKNKKKGR